MTGNDAALRELAHAILCGDSALVSRLLASSPRLAKDCFQSGATRATAMQYRLDQIGGYIVAGDTALHLAAAAYQKAIAKALLAAGANVHARNRHGAEPLHAAAIGRPGSADWNPTAQSEMIALLIGTGANPNATDKRGVTPLHRAVRTRSAAAAGALINGGADPTRTNGGGSTAMTLAKLNTGRGGSGSEEAKAQQKEILQLLAPHFSR